MMWQRARENTTPLLSVANASGLPCTINICLTANLAFLHSAISSHAKHALTLKESLPSETCQPYVINVGVSYVNAVKKNSQNVFKFY